MKYIITESKMEQVAIKYLNKFYGDLKEYKIDKYPNRVFYMKDNKMYMELDMNLEDNIIWVEYETIWGDLKNMFGLETPEIKHIITKWVEDTYKLNGVSLNVEECPSRYFPQL
jgi:hypothetical protein